MISMMAASVVMYAPAVSSESTDLARTLEQVAQQRETSVALGARLRAVEDALADAIADSPGVEDRVRNEASRLLLALPSDLPLPEFAVEDDGAIAVEWLPSRSRMVSLSVHGRGRVAYAWLDGTDKGHGVARFNGKELPEVLLSVIRSVTDGSRFRAA
ncbi:MAG TPA: hypothetical protein PLL78_07385 [Fimbriimonadaceae bacterium]|nr:hypothetical protein [Fimbriimonadaceae bacterium]HRJ96495.1 hypothetical protein [Fimbriimonadaceae bacterium]